MGNASVIKLEYILSIISIFVLSSENVLGQNTKNDHNSFLIYLDIGKVNKDFSNYMNIHDFKTTTRLSMGMIDKNRDGVAELEVIKRYINKVYPNKDDSGLCVVDWEGVAIKQLKAFAKDTTQHPEQINEYIKVVKTIKEMRPNVKVGVYGIPFRMWAYKQLKNNPYKYENLFPLLKISDFISPSVYHLYADSETPKHKNRLYFRKNIIIALKLGSKLNKPVIPYVGMRYYTKRSKYSWESVPIENFKEDMVFIKNLSFNSDKIKGFILWNGDRHARMKKLNRKNKNNLREEKSEFLEQHFSLLKKYSSTLDSLR